MKILVTGCAGFIGSTVAALLLDKGHQVLGIDNLNDSYDVRLKEWRLAQLKGTRNFLFNRIDIDDRTALQTKILDLHRSDLNNPLEVIVNLAARAGVRQSVQGVRNTEIHTSVYL